MKHLDYLLFSNGLQVRAIPRLILILGYPLPKRVEIMLMEFVQILITANLVCHSVFTMDIG